MTKPYTKTAKQISSEQYYRGISVNEGCSTLNHDNFMFSSFLRNMILFLYNFEMYCVYEKPFDDSLCAHRCN